MKTEKEQQKNQEATELHGAEANDISSSDDSAEDSPEEQAEDQADLSEKLKRLEAQLAEYKDRYVRAVAESENQRKRYDREKSDLLKFGNEKVISDLLPVLDSFEKAIESGAGDEQASSYKEGVLMVHKQLNDVLLKHGVQPVKAIGEAFDPNMHQAIQRVEEDVAAEMVKEEFQKGYTLNERLVRPAIVSVAVPIESKEEGV